MDEYGFGSRGPGVQLLQLGLSRAGYQPGRIDGSFGRGTENALRQFQQAQGLPATGRSDAATWQAMMPWLIGTRFVQLRQGDTFWRLSQQYDTSVAAISAANPELDPRDLRPGHKRHEAFHTVNLVLLASKMLQLLFRESEATM